MLTRLVLGTLTVLSMAACGAPGAPVGSEPAGDDLQSNLEARGVTIDLVKQGDAGCRPERGYDDQALRMDITFGDPGARYSVFLIEWPDLQSYTEDAARDRPGEAHPFRPYRECVADYVNTYRKPVVQVESFPWRAYGPELPDSLRQVFLDSMHAAGGL